MYAGSVRRADLVGNEVRVTEQAHLDTQVAQATSAKLDGQPMLPCVGVENERINLLEELAVH